MSIFFPTSNDSIMCALPRAPSTSFTCEWLPRTSCQSLGGPSLHWCPHFKSMTGIWDGSQPHHHPHQFTEHLTQQTLSFSVQQTSPSFPQATTIYFLGLEEPTAQVQGSTKEFTRAHDWLFSEEEMNRFYPLHTKTQAKYYLFTLHCSLTATDREVWGQRYAFGPQIPPAASPHSLPGLRAPKLPSLAPHLSSGLTAVTPHPIALDFFPVLSLLCVRAETLFCSHCSFSTSNRAWPVQTQRKIFVEWVSEPFLRTWKGHKSLAFTSLRFMRRNYFL